MFVATTRVVDAPSSWLEVIASSDEGADDESVTGLRTSHVLGDTHPASRPAVDSVQGLLHLIREHIDERSATSIPEREITVLVVA